MKKVVVDVGANHGKMTQKYLDAGFIVVAIEPNIVLANELENKFKEKDVFVFPCVCSSESYKFINFSISNADTISTCSNKWKKEGRFAGQYSWAAPKQIETIALQDILNILKINGKEIYLIKVDVEGNEEDVLLGLKEPIPFICFEWTEEFFDDAKKCVKILIDLGYNDFALLDGEGPTLGEELKYDKWENIDLGEIKKERKWRYGMLWAKF